MPPAKKWSRARPRCCRAFAPGWPADRLGLARWLVDRKNPLTARVTVNRFWQMLFGTGLVKTVEDFGSQGEWPLHPELLDWLAVEFMDSGWSVKHIDEDDGDERDLPPIVAHDPELLERDPENRLLARGARYRLSPEMLRDQALAVSGLLVEKVGRPLGEAVSAAGTVAGTLRRQRATSRIKARDSTAARSTRTGGAPIAPPSMMNFDSSEPRGLRGARKPHQHAAAGAQPDERHHLPGGGPQTRGEDARRMAAWHTACSWCWGARREPRSSTCWRRARRASARTTGRIRRTPRSFSARAMRRAMRKLDPVELAAYTGVASLLLNMDEAVTRQ